MLISEMHTTQGPSLVVMTPGYFVHAIRADWRWRHLPHMRAVLRKRIGQLRDYRRGH